MRRLIVSTFASLDGIMQAPGGPEEDPTGGFTLGGWMFNYWDDVMDLSASGFDGKDRELVHGDFASSCHFSDYEARDSVEERLEERRRST